MRSRSNWQSRSSITGEGSGAALAYVILSAIFVVEFSVADTNAPELLRIRRSEIAWAAISVAWSKTRRTPLLFKVNNKHTPMRSVMDKF
jgi:hypothetical protein